MEILLEPGLLESRVPRQIERGLASGDLQPTATSEHEIVDEGISFSVRVIEGLDRKKRSDSDQAQTGVDPFMPPYRDTLFVADVSDTHVALLNKFPVLRDHLLVVTRAFEPQESVLNEADFAALWACMSELGGLGFYNGGPRAGASQPHKHLQWIPLVGDLPTARLLDPGRAPFRCAGARVGDGGELAAQYQRLREELKLADSEPYNLLLTPESMILIPRTRHAASGIFVNALGYAGSFLVRSADDMEKLRELRPVRVLAAASRPV